MSAAKGKVSMWLRFFQDAGIPSSFATKYALVFDENRIKMDMLLDINKECLRDMGITAMGDIISIVKHAKQVHDEYKTQAYEVPKPTSSTVTVTKKIIPAVQETSPASSETSSSSSTSGGPRNVIINSKLVSKSSSNSSKEGVVVSKYTGTKTVSDRATIQQGSSRQSGISRAQQVCDSTANETTKNTIVRLKRSVSPVQKEEVPFQRKIRVPREQEGKYKIIMPEGTTAKTQKLLQDRLGPSLKPSGSGASGGEKKSSVFNRLGGSGSGAGDVRVSSSTEMKSRDRTPEKRSEGAKPSIFSRLGQEKASEKLPMSNASTGTDFLKTKFTVKQAIGPAVNQRLRSPPPPINQRLRSPPVRLISKSEGPTDQVLRDRQYLMKRQASLERRFVRQEKTLTTIHSSISRSLVRSRDSSYERRSSGSVSSSSSRTRLSMDGNDIVSVKSRLGRRSQGRSRSRSPSPPPKRRLESSDGYRRAVPSTNSEASGGSGTRQQLGAPTRSAKSNSTGVSSLGKVVSSKVVKSADLPATNVGQVVKEERYRNSEGKLFIRRTIMRKIASSNTSKRT